jgi:hypothetical protein
MPVPNKPVVGETNWGDKLNTALDYLDNKVGPWVAVPATATSTGTAGQIAYASGFLYVCVATNTWRRTALTTWS